MTDRPITSQCEALRLWPQDRGVYMSRGFGGRYGVQVDGRTVHARVWERLLERGDLEIREAWGSGPPEKELWITRQGIGRLALRC